MFDQSISEIDTQGYWFQGILGDDTVTTYINSITSQPPKSKRAFTITTTNPATLGSHSGIIILQLIVSNRVSHIALTLFNTKLSIQTKNIRRFAFTEDPFLVGIESFVVDGVEFEFRPPIGPTYVRDLTWTV